MSVRPGYKQTEIGEIPEAWQAVPIKNIVESYRNGIYKRAEFYGHGVPSVRMYNIKDGKVNIVDAPLLEVTQEEIEQYGLKAGDIVVNRVNSIDLVGKAGIVPEGLGPATFESKNIRIRVHAEKCRADFLAYFLNTDWWYRQVRSSTKAAVSQATINQDDLDHMVISLPPLEEQSRIVSILSAADEAIQETGQIISETQQLKKALLQQLLTKGIGHTKFRKTEIGEVPEEWVVARLEKLAMNMHYGTSVKATPNVDGYPVLGTTNILRGEIDVSDLRYARLPESEIKQAILEEGDLLLVRTNANPRYIGRCALFEKYQGTWLFASYLIRMKPDMTKILPRYLNIVLQSPIGRKAFFTIARTSAGNYNINIPDIRSVIVPLPPIDEQHEIVSILTSIDEKAKHESHRKQSMDMLKRGLMQDLLSGRVRVKVN
jgi:type I restriction enzyme S subunit